MRRRPLGVLWFLLVFACAHAGALSRASVPLASNDNRIPAGRLHDGTLTLRLRIVQGDWQAESALPAWRMLAFAEDEKPAITPGPLIRVVLGTRVEVDIRNESGSALWVHGLHARSAVDVPLHLPAGGRATARFTADTAGTFYYWGTLGRRFDQREGRDSELSGALIVDARGTRTDDRIFVISRHGAANEGGDGVGAWAINGRSWPQTERLDYRVGEPILWRWINATGHRHPLHLHGNFFRITSAGDNARDRAVRPDEQRDVVTQTMQAGSTMAVVWTPLYAGNWLFHCHNLLHVMPDNRIPAPQWYEEYAQLPHDEHMAGLVLGVHVHDGAASAVFANSARRIALRAAERPGFGLDYFGHRLPLLGYSIDGSAASAPGPALVLERGRPVEIAIRNDLRHATSVHWHGIELANSYYDGVPHWGVDGDRTTPWIEPGADFVARFTPLRSGTYIYHTHFNDYAQLTAGLYGALIVVEPGGRLDEANDHVYVFSQGPDDAHDPILVNGVVGVPSASWRGGRVHRIRLIGITASSTVHVALSRDGTPQTWRPLAKDGADLAASLTAPRTATIDLSPGETYDFSYTAQGPAALRLEAGIQGTAEPRTIAPIDIEP